MHNYDLEVRPDKTLDFFVNKLGLIEVGRDEYPEGKFNLVFLATEKGVPEIELTYNWGSEEKYTGGRNFGHIAFEVETFTKCAKGFRSR